MTGFAPDITQSSAQTALRAFLLAIMPDGMEIVAGIDNRVPEPSGSNFIVMTPLFRNRLETNITDYADASFMGAVSGTVLTVSAMNFGVISIGATVFGPSIADGTKIAGFGSGTGGAGTYQVSVAQTVASQKMACGAVLIKQPTKLSMQLDVHGPASADNAQTISTLFRDLYATEFFKNGGFNASPLYAEDPKLVPFKNAEDQMEIRYVVEVAMQIDAVVSPPQQFADQLAITTIEADALL